MEQKQQKEIFEMPTDGMDETWCRLYAKDLPIIGNFVLYQEKTQETKFRLYFNDETTVLATLLSMADSDNGLDMDDPFYEEFFEFYFMIDKIEKIGNKYKFSVGKMECLNYHDFFYKFESIEKE